MGVKAGYQIRLLTNLLDLPMLHFPVISQYKTVPTHTTVATPGPPTIPAAAVAIV